MSLTARDRKILTFLAPLVLVLVYWFFVLGPKRGEAAKAGENLTQQQELRDAAVARAAQLSGAKATFAKDYAAVLRLGKAIPSSVDMPTLIVQLDRAARGTGIDFDKIQAGEREAAPTPAPQPPAQPAGGAGQPAQSAPGQAAQTASTGVSSANAQNQAGAQGAAATGAAAPAGATGAGGAPPAGASPGGAAPASSGAPGLESVPLDFTFTGDYFDLAQFFHRLKRFVRLANDRVLVSGRLMTIEGFTFATGEGSELTAEVRATVYLTPKAEGVAAGASPGGPGATPAAGAPAAGGSPLSPPQTASAPPATPAPATP